MIKIASADGRRSLTLKERPIRPSGPSNHKMLVVTVTQTRWDVLRTGRGRAHCRIEIIADVRPKPSWDEQRIRCEGMRATSRVAEGMLAIIEKANWRQSRVGVTISHSGDSARATWLTRKQSEFGWLPSIEVRVSGPFSYGDDFADNTHLCVVNSLRQVTDDLKTAAELYLNHL